MKKLITIGLCAAACAGIAAAQTKISGTGKCQKPEAQHAIEVGDKPGHMLVMVKQNCSWTTPLEMEGIKSKSYVGVMTADASAGKSQDRGYVVVTMDNGDKAFVRIVSGMSVLDKEGNPVSGEGTWTFTGGTGKFKGLKGKGAYKTKGNDEDMVEGEYTLAPMSAKK
jgi:hypothetical protein